MIRNKGYFQNQLLTSPPRTLASKKIVREPNIQMVIIHETTLREKKKIMQLIALYQIRWQFPSKSILCLCKTVWDIQFQVIESLSSQVSFQNLVRMQYVNTILYPNENLAMINCLRKSQYFKISDEKLLQKMSKVFTSKPLVYNILQGESIPIRSYKSSPKVFKIYINYICKWEIFQVILTPET